MARVQQQLEEVRVVRAQGDAHAHAVARATWAALLVDLEADLAEKVEEEMGVAADAQGALQQHHERGHAPQQFDALQLRILRG